MEDLGAGGLRAARDVDDPIAPALGAGQRDSKPEAASFWWALHRNVIGLDETWIGFTPLWEPPLGWIPLTLAFVAAISAWTANLAALAGRPGAVRRSGSGRAS